VMACFVVVTRSFNRGIVLGHVKINRPRPERVGQCFQRLIQANRIRPIPISGQ
jgi:hypothetical protein